MTTTHPTKPAHGGVSEQRVDPERRAGEEASAADGMGGMGGGPGGTGAGRKSGGGPGGGSGNFGTPQNGTASVTGSASGSRTGMASSGGTASSTGSSSTGSSRTGSSSTGSSSTGSSSTGSSSTGSSSSSTSISVLLQKAGTRWAAAAVGSGTAADLQLASGEPVMAIGGFNGGDPAATLSEFQAYVKAGESKVLRRGRFWDDPAVALAATVRSLPGSRPNYRPTTVGNLAVYDLQP